MDWSSIQVWFSITVLCFVPPKRSFISALPQLPPDNAYKLMFSMNKPDKLAETILKNQVSVSFMEELEPGFDLTDVEIKKFKLWPEGFIPYYIDDFSYDKVLRDRIRNFLAVVNELTGLHFRELPGPPADKKTRWVFFVNRLGQLDCSDHTPLSMTNEGVQKVTLGYHCMTVDGELPEAVLAIVGVPPQHNSPDRDDYVTVEMNNIVKEKQYLFKKLQNSEWLFHDLEYDFLSAGHYSFHKHTKDGLATISPKKPIDVPVGENGGFSYSDILKIRMLYSYIMSKKTTATKGIECDKLFRPGANFSKFEPLQEKDIKPRKKPKKYLGIANDTSSQEESSEKEKGENGIKSSDASKNDDESDRSVEKDSKTDEKDSKLDENDSKLDETDSKSDEKDEGSDGKLDDSDVPIVKTLKGDPVSLLSDFNTEEQMQWMKGKTKKRISY